MLMAVDELDNPGVPSDGGSLGGMITGNVTTEVSWNGVTGAQSYVLRLYNLQDWYNKTYDKDESTRAAGVLHHGRSDGNHL